VDGSALLAHGLAAPAAFDHARIARDWDDFQLALDSIADDKTRLRSKAILADERGHHLLQSLFGNSPFLSGIALRHPDWLARLLDSAPQVTLESLVARTRSLAKSENQTDLMRDLRLAKQEAALVIAMADITSCWTLEEVTRGLADFADAAVHASVEFLLHEAAKAGQILRGAEDILSAGSGLAILGMGKYGGFELNYSSDIDLVVFYEPGQMQLKDGMDSGQFFVRLTKTLVRILQDRTEHGYVFRTDLRLRPDPGGTPVAVSLPAAEEYYESRGQNWERAAFIKARAVAGDMEAGSRFLKMLTPYIWRKNLDYAAIEDVHSMKRQIHAVQGHGTIAVAGHNIKLGRGGIREIEFFVQTQQLIAGGRDRDLRGSQTCAMLDALAAKNWIAQDAADELKEAYRFLRTLEHRLQMVNDDQTHTVPALDEGVRHIACFMGFPDRDAFADALTTRLQRVQRHYARLFETAPPLAEAKGSLVFTGTEDDPETLETLRGLGFDRASEMAATIRGWHSGRFPATRSPRSRELLTSLMPALLRALSRTSNPDTAFTRFDSFLTALPAGVQLFSMLYSNPGLLDLLADICGTAPRLAIYLGQNPAVLEAVVDPNFFAHVPDRAALHASLNAALSHARDYQDTLDFARVWAREHRFRMGVRVLTGSADAEEAGAAYAAIASELIAALAPVALDKVAERHGYMPDGKFVVVSMGKLGSEEMSTASDLDLIVIYDVKKTDQLSDGAKPLMPSQYYARLCQQLISALTAPTAEGKLYEVDMRLRPSGNSGPIATFYDSFLHYQSEEAWTWEHMALTRARTISGESDLQQRVTEAISTTLKRKRQVGKIAFDVVDMRGRIEREFPSSNPWELKYVRGGLVDLEFICQYLQLIHATKHPDILHTHTRTAYARIADASVIPAATADALIAALDLTHNLIQVIRICVEGVFKPEEATTGLKSLLARVGNAPDFAALEAQLHEAQAETRRAFKDIIAAHVVAP